MRGVEGEQTEAVRAIVREFGARPDGFRCREVEALGYAPPVVSRVVKRFLKTGILHRARINYRKVFYFTDVRAAMRAEAGAMTAKVAAPPKPKSAAQWTKDTPPHFPTNPDGTPAYKVTIAPPPARTLRTNTHQGGY